MSGPRLLDLFCCAGGAAMGYHRAGFEVLGVDIDPQPNYPFEFHQGDALEYLASHSHEFDVIHASPPCQAHMLAVSPKYRWAHEEIVRNQREEHAAWLKAHPQEPRFERAARRLHEHECSCHINPPCDRCVNCRHGEHPECPNDCQTCEDHDPIIDDAPGQE